MKMLAMAEPVSAAELETVLNEDKDNVSVLIIDSRSFLAFNSGHIYSAHNAHCPPIVKRRSAGSLPMDYIITCPATRERLLAGLFSSIIVYDEDTLTISELPEDSNMHLVLKSIQAEVDTQSSALFYLEGGYYGFKGYCPHMCTVNRSFPESTGTSCTPGPITFGRIPTSHKYHPERDQDDPVEVLPYLYLGNAYHASQESRLQQLNISALLNVSGSRNIHTPSPCFWSKKICIEDNSMADIQRFFPVAIDYIESQRTSNRRILVHCQAGISRSPTIIIAYLMWQKGWLLEEAFDFLKKKRYLISPNLNFMRQLLEFESELAIQRKESSTSGKSQASSVTPSVQRSLEPPPMLSPQEIQSLCTYAMASGFTNTFSDSGRNLDVNHSTRPAKSFSPTRKTFEFPLPGDGDFPKSAVPTTFDFSMPRSSTLDLSGSRSPFTLPLTPCTQQAAVFSFDSPHTPSPTSLLPVCHGGSPLVSPS